jgi:LacI family transcriptional regulator
MAPGKGKSAKRPAVGRATGAEARRVTLSDVAARAGVSRAAASFVLSGRDDMRIAVDTQQRIRQAADDLGYRPNLNARSLRTGSSGTVAFVSDLVSSTPFAGAAVRGALEALRSAGALLFMGETLGDDALERQVLEGLIDRRVDGFLYASMSTRVVQIPAALEGMPHVLLNCLPRDGDTTCVVPDERGAGVTAARTLLDAGHREGIYLLGSRPPRKTPWALRERRAGIAQELRRAGVALAGSLDALEWEPEDGRTALGALLDEGVRPRAVICMNDRLALGAYQALQAHGLVVPSDVSVISFDDTSLAGWLQPGLSSVALPHYELGHRAVELLLAGELAAGRQLVPMPLRARQSVAARRA